MAYYSLPRLEDAVVTLEGEGNSMSLHCYLACCYLRSKGWAYFVNYTPDDAIENAQTRMIEFERMSQ